jgi:hypothetical protein
VALGQFDGGGVCFRRIEKDGLPGHARHEAPKEKVGDAHVVSEQRPDLETSPARAENTLAGKTFIADDAQGLPLSLPDPAAFASVGEATSPRSRNDASGFERTGGELRSHLSEPTN